MIRAFRLLKKSGMAYLGKYIRQILSKQEAVIFPGFGSLVFAEGKGSKGSDGKIEPPGMLIKFDAEHPREDGKLAEEYAEGEGIEFEEARQQVLELVDAIKFKLDKGEKYNLELLGTFWRDDDNRIHFEKDPNWVVDPELFGLNSLDLLELDSEEAKEEEASPIQDRKGSEAEPAEGKAEAEKRATTSGEKKATPGVVRKPVNKWKIIWIVVGSLFVVLVLILLIPTGNSVEFGKDGIIIRDTAGQETSTQATGEEEKTQEEISEPDLPGTTEEIIPETPEEPPVQSNRYFLIAGSFQNLQNATELMEELKSAGYPAEIIITENRSYRVSIKSYPTKQEALNDIEKVRASSGHDKAWLLTR